MDEQFTRLKLLPRNLYTEGSPVLIMAGALLRNNERGQILAQLKFRNLSNKSISAIKVKLNTFDAFEQPLDEDIEYQYLDLDIKPHSFHLDRRGILLKNANVRNFSVSVSEVMFDERSIWKSDAMFEPAPTPKKLEDFLPKPIIEQYNRDTNDSAIYEPIEYKDIWFCTCGRANKSEDGECFYCKRDKHKLISAYNYDLIAEHLAEYKKQEAEKAEAQRIKQEKIKAEKERKAEERRKKAKQIMKKAKKPLLIITPIICVCIAFAIMLALLIIPNSKYNTAISLLNKGKVNEAYDTLIALNGYRDSAEKASEIYDQYKLEIIKTAKIGDIVILGTYEQDNNLSNGEEDIEWVVHAKSDNKILLICDKAIDCKPYNTSYDNIVWEMSSIRRWLNSDFYNSAFNENEQAMIINTSLKADENSKSIMKLSKSTDDKVYLLDCKEAETYFSCDEARLCIPTEYAKANGASINSSFVKDGKATCNWWLRSSGKSHNCAANVYPSGLVSTEGSIAVSTDICIRPAIWITFA